MSINPSPVKMEDTETNTNAQEIQPPVQPAAGVNLSLSLDDIIKQRRSEEPKQKKKRTPIKSRKDTNNNKPTPTQKVVGAGKAKRNAQMRAKRGLGGDGTPSKAQIDKEIYRQQRSGKQGGKGSAPQACTVYVGNLSWDTSWRELKTHFRNILPSEDQLLRVDVMTNPETKKSKGFGIAEFTTPRASQEACRLLNETELDGRTIYVRENRIPVDQEKSVPSGKGSGPQTCNVYVGNLSYGTSWQTLKDHMRQAGNVDRVTILSAPDGRSKGCGIVVYQHPKDAARAIKTLDGSVLEDRELFVREDREVERSGPGSGGSNPPPGLSVFVGNLSFDTQWQGLKDHMRRAGNVDRAMILSSPEGRSKGCGIVVYQHPKDAARAIKTLQDSTLDGRQIFVREDRENGGQKNGGSR